MKSLKDYVMNFFKDKELALRFKNNEVPSKERFSYLIFGSVLGCFLSSSFLHSEKINGIIILIFLHY